MKTCDLRTNSCFDAPIAWLELSRRNKRAVLRPTKVREATRGGGHVLSFVPAEHILDGIHDGRISVFVAIAVKLLLILFDCFGFDDRVVAFAVVVPAKPQLRPPSRSTASFSIRTCSHVILETSTVTCACIVGICANRNKVLVRSRRSFTVPSIARVMIG